MMLGRLSLLTLLSVNLNRFILRDFSTFLMVTTFVPLRKLERVFHCCSVCETMEHYKEGYLIIMVWTNYMSLLAALLLGYTLR